MPVPSVQELVKEIPSTVPPRYVHSDHEPPIISDNTSLPQVPVFDMQRLFSSEFIDLKLEKLHHACKEFGFFQVIISVSVCLSLSLSLSLVRIFIRRFGSLKACFKIQTLFRNSFFFFFFLNSRHHFVKGYFPQNL